MQKASTDLKPLLGACDAFSLNPRGSLGVVCGRDRVGLVDPDTLEISSSIATSKATKSAKNRVEETQFSFHDESKCALAAGDNVEIVKWTDSGEFVPLTRLTGII